MPDDRIKISALPSALSLNNTDVLAIVQGMNEGETKVSRKAALTILAAHLLEVMTYNNLSTADKTIVGAVNSLLSNFADSYDDTSTYDVGDCVIYNGVLYQCNTAITVAEAWDATHWTQIKAVDAGAGGFSIDVIADEYDSSLTYAVGDYVIYQDQLYKCNTAITSPEAWTAAHWTLTQVGPQLQTKADRTAVDEAIENLLPVGNASGSVANFSTELSRPLEALKAGIVATQASGTPTPSSPLQISGWSQVEITHADENMQTIDSDTISLGNTYFGGYVTQDKTGHRQLVVTYSALLDMGDLTWANLSPGDNIFRAVVPNCKFPSDTADRKNGFLCSIYPASSTVSISANMTDKSLLRYNGWIVLRDTSYSDYTELASSLIGGKLIYEIDTPIIVDLPDGVPFETLIGVNNIFADSGDILECKYKDTIQHYIDTQIAATQALIL